MATSYLGYLGKTLAILTPPTSFPLTQQVHRTKRVSRGAVPAGRQQARLDRRCVLGFFFIFYEAMKARMAAPAHSRVWALAQHNLLLATLLKHLRSSPHENTSFSLTGLPSLFTSCMCSIFVDWLAWPGEPIMALASESDCVLPGRHCVGFLPKELTVSSEFP